MVFILWVALCLAVGYFAKNRGRSFWTFALLSVIISPIGGYIVLLIASKKNKEQNPAEQNAPMSTLPDAQQPYSLETDSSFCPSCGSKVPANGKFCPSCGKEIN